VTRIVKRPTCCLSGNPRLRVQRKDCWQTSPLSSLRVILDFKPQLYILSHKTNQVGPWSFSIISHGCGGGIRLVNKQFRGIFPPCQNKGKGYAAFKKAPFLLRPLTVTDGSSIVSGRDKRDNGVAMLGPGSGQVRISKGLTCCVEPLYFVTRKRRAPKHSARVGRSIPIRGGSYEGS
jgi:hypothetical protein